MVKNFSAYPKTKDFLKNMKQEKAYSKKRILDSKNPTTTNSVERVIREFQRKYNQMDTFCSFYSARAWCQLFQVYYRLSKFDRGHRKGKSPAEIMGYDVKGLEWTDFVLPPDDLYLQRKQFESA